MDNATRKDLLYKARAAGYPGSILDVFAAYSQGRDLIAEYQQEQKMQQAQQMSDFVASQTLQQPQAQPQMPQASQVPSSPPSVQANVPLNVQPTNTELVDSSKQTNVGIVSNQTGSYKGRAIFAKGGFKGMGPGCPDGYFKNNEGKCVEILPKSEFRDKSYFDKIDEDYCKQFPGAGGCYKSYKEAMSNKDIPGFAMSDLRGNLVLGQKDADYKQGLKTLEMLEQKPLTFKEFDAITNGKGSKILESEGDTEILKMLDKNSVDQEVKTRYAQYNRNKLAKITDPVTGKLLPTNDPRAQIDLRETMWNRQPTKEDRTTGSINENRKQLGYPIDLSRELFWNRDKGRGELPMRAVKIGIKGLLEEEYIKDSNGKFIKNPNYTGNLSEEGKEWIEKATSEYGIDPAILGYFNRTSMSDSTKTLADYDPSLLVDWERYSKQPILSVNMEDNTAPVLSWASREPILTSKYAPDMEGAVPVTGAIKTGFLDKKNKKKKKLGGIKDKCYTCKKISRVKK